MTFPDDAQSTAKPPTANAEKSWQCQPNLAITAQPAREKSRNQKGRQQREQGTVQCKSDYAVCHFASPEQPSGSVFRMAGFAVGDHYRPLRSNNK